MTSRWYIVPGIAGTAFILTLLCMVDRQGGNAAIDPLARALVRSDGLGDLLKSPRAAPSALLSALRVTPVASAPRTVAAMSAANEESGASQNPTEELAPPPPEESQKLVPVLFRFEATSGAVQVGATVRNMSGKPLDLKIAAADPTSGNQTVVQLVIPPHGTEDLATQGLVLSSASVLTVQSPPYLERSVTVQ